MTKSQQTSGIQKGLVMHRGKVVDKYLEFISGFGGGVENLSMKREQAGGDDFSYLEDDDMV
jgi:hypothetical protein